MNIGNRKWIIHILSILITLILLIFFFSTVDLQDIARILSSIDPLYLGIGFLLYVFTYVLRAIRFRILLNHAIPFFRLFPIVCVHNMANSVLPAKSGELSYVYLVKKFGNIQTGEGIATLLVARIFDLICIIPLFILSFFLLEKYSGGNQYMAPLFAVVLVFLVILIVSLFRYGKPIFGRLHQRFQNSSLQDVSVLDFLFRKGSDMIEALEGIKSRKGFFFGKLSVVSLSIWISIFLLNYVLILAMGIEMGFLEVMFASSFGICATMLPIQGILGLGTFETGWTIGFMAVGLSYDLAVSTGFGYHIIVILYFSILGLFGILILLKPRLSCIVRRSGNTSSDTEPGNS